MTAITKAYRFLRYMSPSLAADDFAHLRLTDPINACEVSLRDATRGVLPPDVPHVVLRQNSLVVILASVSLLFPGRPLAIAWLIMAIVVYAMDTVGRAGASSNVVAKCLKAMAPPVADSNTAPTVSVPTGVIGVRTTRVHSLPDAICRRPFAATTGAMFQEHGLAMAATRNGVPRSQARRDYLRSVAAITGAHPPPSSVRPSLCDPIRDEMPKTLAGYVYRSSHGLNVAPTVAQGQPV